DAATGEDRRRAELAREDCEAACYDCLMSYGNQGDHGILDRAGIKPILLQLAAATVAPVHLPASAPAQDSSTVAAGSDVERDWLRYLVRRGHRPPARAGVTVEACGATPDFLYEQEGCKAAIYVDDPPGASNRSSRDAAMVECL